jgi:hypothetical protein
MATEAPSAQETATAHPSRKKPQHNNAKQCNALTNQLGSVMDKMDAARRQGYTIQKMDAWNQTIKTLERKKQQANCF